MKKQIVKRTYSIHSGKPSTRIEYIASPTNAIGQEITHTDVNRAYLFNLDEIFYKNQTISGNDRTMGDYTYKQEIITFELLIDHNVI